MRLNIGQREVYESDLVPRLGKLGTVFGGCERKLLDFLSWEAEVSRSFSEKLCSAVSERT